MVKWWTNIFCEWHKRWIRTNEDYELCRQCVKDNQARSTCLIAKEIRSGQRPERERWEIEREWIWDTPKNEFHTISGGEKAFLEFISNISEQFYLRAIRAFPELYNPIKLHATMYQKKKNQRKDSDLKEN